MADLQQLDPRRLLIFRAVARAGTISGAARALGWTQPAVSQHLQQLERSAGTPLVVRGSSGVSLTEPGQVLLERVEAMAAQLHLAGEELAAFTRVRRGRVRLVAFPSASAVLVPGAVRALADVHPEVEVGLQVAEPPEALSAVRAGDADLALVFEHDDAPLGHDQLGQLTWRPLVWEPVHLVLPPEHAAGGRRTVRLAALADEDWIGGCERCRVHLVARCRAAGFEPRVRHTTDDYVVVQNLVARGLGVTLLPRSALTAYRHPEVVVRESAALGRRRVGLVHRPGADAVPAIGALLRELVAHVAPPNSGATR